MKTVAFRMVDAFAEKPFMGNPAGVVLDADGLSTEQMQTIAREVNASETSFLTGLNNPHAPPRLRWFTPQVEAGFCGHATLAAAHAWYDFAGRSWLAKRDNVVRFESAAGLLELRGEVLPEREESPLWWLAMPEPRLTPETSNLAKTCECLGITEAELEPGMPVMRTRDDDVILFVKAWSRLAELRPRMGELGDWQKRNGIRGHCVSCLETLSDSVDVCSRFFAPAVGIPEDPVTGSMHGPLAVLLVASEQAPLVDGRAALTCVQGEPGGRTGLIRAVVEQRAGGEAGGYRVFVGGMTQTIVRGEMRVPG